MAKLLSSSLAESLISKEFLAVIITLTLTIAILHASVLLNSLYEKGNIQSYEMINYSYYLKIAENIVVLKYILSDDAKYAIYTELVNLYDVLDSMVFDREIPHFNPLEVGVKLILDKRVYHRFDTLRYVVINLGYPTVCFGSSYKIYYYNGTDWILANWLMGFFTLELHCIGTFGYWQGSLYLNGTMHGKYLLVKEIILEPNDYRLLLSEEFEVIE